MIHRSARVVAALLVAWAGAAPGQVPDSAREARYRRMLRLPELVRGGIVTPSWLPDGARFWYPAGPVDSTTIVLVDPEADRVAPLVDVAALRASLARVLGREPPYRGIPFRTLTFTDARTIRFTLEGRTYETAVDPVAVRAVPGSSAEERGRTEPQVIRSGRYGGDPDIMELPSPDGRWLAGDEDHDIRLRATADGRSERLTSDGTTETPWSIATNSEWGETSHTAKWSPDGLSLAVMRADYAGVSKLPLVHWLKPIEEVEWRPYVKAGGRLPATELVIIDVASKRRVPVDSGATDRHYVLPIRWLPDASALLYYRMRRDYKVLEVFAADRRTGASRLLVRETQPTFIKGIASNPGWTSLFTLLDDGSKFLWLSERDGWDHLYLYGIDGTLIRRLTTGRFPVLRVMAVDARAGWVYFTAHAERRLYDTHLYRVGLDGRGFRRLTAGDGEHEVAFAPSLRYFVDVHSSLTRPPATELRAADGRLVRVLVRASLDSLRAIGWRAPEEVWTQAADGATPIRSVLTVPGDLDPARRYPVLENIYGGPQLVYAPRSFVSQTFNQALAQLGFVVVTTDARGTIERGKAFQDVVYRQFGRNEIPDHVAALDQLAAARPWMDLQRTGIFGGSWGGYMTIRALVLAPERYRAGMAIYPVADLEDHWNLIEAYMDLPDANPAGYADASSLRRAGAIRGRLALVHGTSDVNATFSASMKMVEALTRAGRQYDLLVFPEETHAMSPSAVAYRTSALTRFFTRHLEP